MRRKHGVRQMCGLEAQYTRTCNSALLFQILAVRSREDTEESRQDGSTCVHQDRHDAAEPGDPSISSFHRCRSVNSARNRVRRSAADRDGKGKKLTDARNDHATARPEERRALGADELQMTDLARHPALGKLSDQEISDLVSRLRSRRNRARDISDRQGREARAKSDPAGATSASGNAGTLAKHDYLNAALERAMDERRVRGTSEEDTPEAQDDAQPSQHDMALKAMALKEAGDQGPNAMMEDGGPVHPSDPDASAGKGNLADKSRRTAPSGALDHAGELPSRERSRTRY